MQNNITTKNIGFEFYTTTVESWDAMLKECSEAKESILMEEYVLHVDTIGTAFIDVLERKLGEGVKVKLLLDWWGSKEFYNSKRRKQLEEKGAEIKFFRPFSMDWFKGGPKFFPRDHRKILIIDKKTTFAGGVCIYDDITHWRDTMIKFSSNLTDQFLHIFYSTWNRTSDNVEENVHPKFETTDGFSVYANSPDLDEKEFTEELYKKIANAKKSIKLTTPYFVPGDKLKDLIIDASNRGVRVEIILSNYSAYPTLVLGKKIAGELIMAGVNIYYYKPDMLHLKMMIVDDEWAAIGSCNLDGLSLHNNYEAMLVAKDRKFINELDEHFTKDLEHSDPFTFHKWQNRAIDEKLSAYLFMPFRKYL